MFDSTRKIDEPNRTRLVAGGDRVHYPFDAGTPTADLLTVKLLINSVKSTPGARFFTMDIKNFYLNTPMVRYKYMRLKLVDMPADVIEHYKLLDVATPDGYVYVIGHGMNSYIRINYGEFVYTNSYVSPRQDVGVSDDRLV